LTAHIFVALIVGVSILLMLIRPRNIPEFYWVGGGAILLLVFRLMPPKLAGHAIAKSLDVCFFLTGMMLVSELARETGIFDWLSSMAVRGAKGSCSRLFLLVYGIGTIVTIFMSNDATAVVLTPAILAIVRKAKVGPLPYLFACAFIANAASFVLPISNPANLVVFGNQVPPLGKWLLSFAIPSVFSILATFLSIRWMFRKEMDSKFETKIEGDDTAILLTSDGRLVLSGLTLMTAVLLTASALGKDLGLPTCLAALAVSATVWFKGGSDPARLAREVSWGTLALVAALFVMVDAVQSIGGVEKARQWLVWAQNLGSHAATFVVGFAVGVANNLVNNLPLGLIAGDALRSAHTTGSIVDAVLIGVDLGPNLSITGSLATILWLIALRKEKLHVTFWDFLKVGILAMPVALFASLCGEILMRIWFPAS
jgi:arsenical pump membrane protein